MSSGGYGIGGYGQDGYGGGGNEIFVLPLPYYLSLIASQYQNSPKLLAVIQACLQKFADISTLLYTMSYQFVLYGAVGVQLDVLGEIVGVSRTVDFQPLIYATIIRNQWDGQITSLYPLWQLLFPGGKLLIFDNQNMSVTVVVSGGFSSIIQDLITHDYIVPRAEGVLMNYEFAALPMFGFSSTDTAFISGFGTSSANGGLWS